MIETREFHPVSEIFPLMQGDEFEELVGDIRSNGLREPIWLDADGLIIDGRNRYRACSRAKVEPQYRIWDGQGSLVAFVISLNLHRRHLNESQRAMVAAKVANLSNGQRREALSIDKAVTEPEAAGLLNVSVPSVSRARRVVDHGAPEVVAAVQSGQVAVSAAARVVELPRHEQVEIIARGEEEIRRVAKEIEERRREENRQKRDAKIAELRARPEPLIVPCQIEQGDACALPLQTESVDLIVTSPPYGLDVGYETHDDNADDWPDFMRSWLQEAYRVSRVGGRLALNVPLDTTRGGFRPVYAHAVKWAEGAGWIYRSSIVWNENNISKSVARGSVRSASSPHVIAPVEMIALFSKGEWKREQSGESDIDHEDWLAWTNGLWAFPGQSRGFEGHPAPFPEELPKRLIYLLSFPGDVILDPFLGSGTTALIAHRLGRKAIGFDISPDYVAMAKRRLASE